MDLELLQSLFGVVPLSSTVNTGLEQKNPGCWDSVKGEYDNMTG